VGGQQGELTIIQSPDIVRKHPQQVAEADGRDEQSQIEEEKFACIQLESREKVEYDYEDDVLEGN
jgi:hypothetical protein